jgi:hypothetical protein
MGMCAPQVVWQSSRPVHLSRARRSLLRPTANGASKIPPLVFGARPRPKRLAAANPSCSGSPASHAAPENWSIAAERAEKRLIVISDMLEFTRAYSQYPRAGEPARGSGLCQPAMDDSADHVLSTFRCQAGILVGVHSVLLESLRLAKSAFPVRTEWTIS